MINSAPQPYIRRLRLPAYLILGLALCVPIIDFLTQMWPMHPGLLTWRFGAIGILATTISGPLLILLFIYAFSLAAGDRRVALACAAIAAVIVVILIAGAGSFVLDAVQMKRRVPASRMAQFDSATFQALFKLAVYSLSALVLSVSIFRTLRLSRVMPGDKEVKQGALLVGVKADKRPSIGTLPEPEPAMQAELAEASATALPSSAAAPAGESPARTVPKSAARAPSVGMMPPPPPPRRPE